MSNLYGKEIGIWNPVTDEVESEEQKQERAAVEQAIVEGRFLEAMRVTDGWQLLEKYLKTQAEDLKQLLSYETDYKKVRRLQEAIKAYTSILLFVDYKINEGKMLSETEPRKG